MCCRNCSVKKVIDQATQHSKEIDEELWQDADKYFNTVKVLILGAGESGKSTLIKQMKILHGGGLTPEEILSYRYVVLCNTLQAMLAILRGMGKLKIDFVDSSCLEDAQLLFKNVKNVEDGFFTSDMTKAITKLWQDGGVRDCLARSSEYQLTDSAAYFLDSVDRISQSNYVPTQADILRTRLKTTGIVEECFFFHGLNFRLLDVGGQRSERKKWIHCFEDVEAIIFLAALSEYDLVLCEDDETNRMRESMKLFSSICNNRWFTKTSMILFLNKKDVFNEKIRRIPLTVCFPEYRGANTPGKASTYIQKKFDALNRNPKKTVYTHFTCATDTEQIGHIFDEITDIILKANFRTHMPY